MNREDDLDRELRDHVDLEAEDRAATGLAPAAARAAAARAAAARAFGSVALVKEDTREAWATAWVERARQDLRFAARMMVKAPTFSAVAILTLALGVGASTAIFSQINAVFWKALPVSNPHQLRSLVWSSRKPAFVGMPNVIAGPHLDGVDTYGSFSYVAYKSMRDGTTSLSNLACWTDLGEARPVVMRDVGFGAVHFVSGNYFETLGVHASLGRVFTADDDTPGTTAAILSHPFWQRAFGGRLDVLQRTIDLNGRAFAIVGVTPAGFFGVDPSAVPDVMVPISAIQVAAATVNPTQNPLLWQLCRTFGRLRPGVTEEEARTDAERWLREAILAHPPQSAYEPPRMRLMDGDRGLGTLRDAMSTPLLILMGVVISILLIACANIAGLLIVRGAAREREMVTRLALGASRGRLVRQLLTESLLLSAAGGIVGVAFAYGLASVSPALMSRFMPTVFGVNRQLGIVVTPDARVLMFSAAVTMLTGVIFGCLPAFRSTRMALMASIRQPIAGGRRQSGWPVDKALVALQAALSLMLVIGAGLFLRTIDNLRTTPLGFDPGGLLYARIEPRTGGIPTEQRAAFFERVVTRLESFPGVVSVTATDAPPFSHAAAIFMDQGGLLACAPGFVAASPQDGFAAITSVAPRYFETLRTPLVAGRELAWSDAITAATPRTAFVGVVNEAFVRKFFGGKNPLEQRFGLNCPARPADFQVVGVVADSKNVPRQSNQPRLYLAMGGSTEVVTLIIRTPGRPEAMIQPVKRAMADLNANVPTFGEVTPVELREQRMQQERLLTTLLLAFGAVALLLSSIGIYGMLAYLVTRRTAEIGIRMALGARPGHVVAMVLRESIVPVISGLAIGVAMTLVATRWINSLLFGISAHDPSTMAFSALVFLLIAAAAAFVPARRASRIDPIRALRTE
jgi:predicted permease